MIMLWKIVGIISKTALSIGQNNPCKGIQGNSHTISILLIMLLFFFKTWGKNQPNTQIAGKSRLKKAEEIYLSVCSNYVEWPQLTRRGSIYQMYLPSFDYRE